MSGGEALRSVLAGIQDAQTWIGDVAPQDVAAELSRSFPDIDRALMESSSARYKDEGVWATNLEVRRTPFLAMQEAIMQGGEALRMLAFEESVDNSLHPAD